MAFLSEYPELVSQWDKKINDKIGLDINKLSSGSNKVAWWICNEGHSFRRRIVERTVRGHGCPYCSGRKILPGFNDFATKNPELLQEWDYEKNKKLGIDPTTIGVGFRPKVWWICRNGHSYDSVIHPRTKGVGCPYCSDPIRKILPGFNDIATTNPDILSEWDYGMNTVTPSEVSRGYSNILYWRCKEGHSYRSKIVDRIRGNGCPYCSGRKAIAGISDLFTKYPLLKSEWDFEKNLIDPTSIVRGGNKQFWWKCERGHEWKSTVTARIGNDNIIHMCPKCARSLRVSFSEKILFFYIKKNFPDALENYRPAWLSGKELDIYIPSIHTAIEYDGAWYHKTERDIEKDSLCNDNKIVLIRIRERGAKKLIGSSSIVFSLPDKNRPDGSHVIPALNFIERQLKTSFNVDIAKDYDEIRKMVSSFSIDNCVAVTNPEVLSEWDYEKNSKSGHTPYNLSAGANVYVYWRCKKGHSYKAILPNKINGGTGCPYCSGRKILKGFNDIATTEPELLLIWDYEKNIISPDEVSSGSNKEVWLKCERGHSYRVKMLNHKKGGCPYCSGHKTLAGFNDLATTHPSLVKEWDYEKNQIKPTEISKGCIKNVWWKCNKGHTFSMTPNVRTSRGLRCPYCSGQRVLAGYNDIVTTNPEIIEEWDFAKNEIKPEEISKGSGKKVWLKCERGHSYKTTLPSRLSGHKCNICSGNKVLKGYNDIATTDPELLLVWNDKHYTPYELSRKSGRRIECVCPECGHEWTTIVSNLTAQKKCPGCKKSLADMKP